MSPFKPNTFFFHSNENWNVTFALIFPRQPPHLKLSHQDSFYFFLFFKRWRASSSFALTSMKLSVVEPPQWLRTVPARTHGAPRCASCCLRGHLWCVLSVLGAFFQSFFFFFSRCICSVSTPAVCQELYREILQWGPQTQELRTLQLQQGRFLKTGTSIQTKVSGFHSQSAFFSLGLNWH